jgi:hypothetical protein
MPKALAEHFGALPAKMACMKEKPLIRSVGLTAGFVVGGALLAFLIALAIYVAVGLSMNRQLVAFTEWADRFGHPLLVLSIAIGACLGLAGGEIAAWRSKLRASEHQPSRHR